MSNRIGSENSRIIAYAHGIKLDWIKYISVFVQIIVIVIFCYCPVFALAINLHLHILQKELS